MKGLGRGTHPESPTKRVIVRHSQKTASKSIFMGTSHFRTPEGAGVRWPGGTRGPVGKEKGITAVGVPMRGRQKKKISGRKRLNRSTGRSQERCAMLALDQGASRGAKGASRGKVRRFF